MRESSPYKTIAVATTFSPRFKHVLAEAKRICDRFAAELHLIHVGKGDQETPRKFNDVLAELGLPADSPIHYEEGAPAKAILAALTREKIDMLLAGALEKEIVLHPFLGNVARRLVREANCSVMLFTHPQKNPKPLRRIVFIANPFLNRSAMNTMRRNGLGFFCGCVNSITEQFASRTSRRATLPRNGCNTISFSSAPARSMSIFSRVSAARIALAGAPSS